jgi:hypothetical protein
MNSYIVNKILFCGLQVSLSSSLLSSNALQTSLEKQLQRIPYKGLLKPRN